MLEWKYSAIVAICINEMDSANASIRGKVYPGLIDTANCNIH